MTSPPIKTVLGDKRLHEIPLIYLPLFITKTPSVGNILGVSCSSSVNKQGQYDGQHSPKTSVLSSLTLNISGDKNETRGRR